MNNLNYDSVIIGGGASGLMCAISAKTKNPKLRICILEKNDRVGKKLLSTGNGRCNLTNENLSANKYNGSFLEGIRNIINNYNTSWLTGVFSDLGLIAKSDTEGRYYPVCKQASAVLDVLRFACERLGIEVFCSVNIKSIKKNVKGYSISCDEGLYNTKKLVICCGSKASPKLGGNASASDYLKNLGHKFKAFSPALCPIKVKSDILKSLKGLRAVAEVKLVRNDRIIKSEKGEVQFTDNALSGICIFNLSVISRKSDTILVDLMGDIPINTIIYRQRNLFTKLSADNIFTGILQKRLAQAVLKEAGIRDFSRLCSTLTDKELDKISEVSKNMSFEVIENCGFDQAQATTGGADGNQINYKTMESKISNGLYICGEAIDVCGDCGGYNLHFAFASGYIAGENL